MLDRLIADFPSIWYGVVAFMAIALILLAAVFVSVSLIIITIKSFIKRKLEDSITLRQHSPDELTKQVKDLKVLREMIDKTLREIDDGKDYGQS